MGRWIRRLFFNLKRNSSEGLDWGVGSAFGAPQMFAPNRSETLQNQRSRGLWTANRGVPPTQVQRRRVQRPILGPLNSLKMSFFRQD